MIQDYLADDKEVCSGRKIGSIDIITVFSLAVLHKPLFLFVFFVRNKNETMNFISITLKGPSRLGQTGCSRQNTLSILCFC